MNISRVVEVRMFNQDGDPTLNYEIDVSTTLLSKKWPKFVYKVMREAFGTCMTGGIVVMKGTLVPRV
jgi:hypothetical protein